MQKVTYPIFTLFILFACLANSKGQNNQTQQEIDKIAEILFKFIQKDSSIHNIAVRHFYHIGQTTPDNLGQYLASELQFALAARAGSRLNFIDRSKIDELFEEVKISDIGLTEEKKKLGRLKSIDAIMEGSMQVKGDYIKLSITTTQIELGAVIPAATEYITITPSLQKMMTPVKASNKKQPAPSKTNDTAGFQGDIFKKDQLQFNLTGCRRIGRYVEAEFEVFNDGRTDVELYIYSNRSHVMDDDNGYEYELSTIVMGGRTDSNVVSKVIPSKSKVTAKFTFSNAETTVTKLSRINVNCWASGSGSFYLIIEKINLQQ